MNATQLQLVGNKIKQWGPAFARKFPEARGITEERFVDACLRCIRAVPKLAECSLPSLQEAFGECAALGILPGGSLGLASIIPYGKDAKLIVEYKGYVRLMLRSPLVKSVFAEVVREGDQFSYSITEEGPRLHHKPSLEARGTLKHAYAICRLASGDTIVCVMPGSEVLAIRAKSPGARKHDSPWNDPEVGEPEMWKKTALRRIRKIAPFETDVDRAAAIDEDTDSPQTTAYREEIRTVEAREVSVADDLDAIVEADAAQQAQEAPQEAPGGALYNDPPIDTKDLIDAIRGRLKGRKDAVTILNRHGIQTLDQASRPELDKLWDSLR